MDEDEIPLALYISRAIVTFPKLQPSNHEPSIGRVLQNDKNEKEQSHPSQENEHDHRAYYATSLGSDPYVDPEDLQDVPLMSIDRPPSYSDIVQSSNPSKPEEDGSLDKRRSKTALGSITEVRLLQPFVEYFAPWVSIKNLSVQLLKFLISNCSMTLVIADGTVETISALHLSCVSDYDSYKSIYYHDICLELMVPVLDD